MIDRRKTFAGYQSRSASHSASKNSSGADAAVLDTLLAQLAVASSRQSAPSAIRQRLVAEARLQSAPRTSFRPRLATAVAAAISAILLIGAAGAGASLLLSRPRFAAAVYATLRSLDISKGPSYDDNPSPALNDVDKNDKNDKNNEDSAALLPSDVFALPYSDPSIANGTETIVRVSVPASQLMAWGVPFPAGELDDDVAADLLLGDDGLPRAIRILPISNTRPAAEESYP